MRRTSATVITSTIETTNPPKSTKVADLLDFAPKRARLCAAIPSTSSRSPNANRALGILDQHRLLVGQVGACGVPLQPGLFVGGESEHVVHDGPRGQFGLCGVDAGVGGGVGQPTTSIRAIASDCPAAKLADTSSAPSVCDSSASRSRSADRAMRSRQSPGSSSPVQNAGRRPRRAAPACWRSASTARRG